MYSLALISCLLTVAAEPTSNGNLDQERFFRAKVEPVLVRHCLECHGADKEGGLDLRTGATALKGGDSGPVITPGKLEESLLHDYVSTGEMPPKGKQPLTTDEIASLRTWIEQGGYFPEKPLDPYAFTTESRGGLDWWSLQPVKDSAIPAVSQPSQCLTPIDFFVLARLEERGLTFSPPADRPTLIRRLMHDLLGLKPSYEQVQHFVKDRRPDAYERLVEEMLASPHYGERWGRHWLDVVRYAESNGFERDRIRRNSWQYRDYVIDSFNQDKPFDQFVREQLAADAIRPDDPKSLVATGFLVAGPQNDVPTISELETLTTRQNELDDFVVATMTTFTGLTVGCARCHDHKFDPIPARDYYRLTAVFSGLDRGENVVAAPERKRTYDETLAQGQQRLQTAKNSLAALMDPVRLRLLKMRAETTPKEGDKALPMVNFRRNVDVFPATDARFVRLVINETNSQNEPCIDELEIYGEGDENLALASVGAKATASTLLPGYPIHQIHHLNDGKPGNSHSWIANEANTAFAQIELACAAKISRVVWGRDRLGDFKDRLPTVYSIQLSVDGQSWTTVSGSNLRPAFDPAKLSEPQVPDDQVLAAFSEQERQQFNRLTDEISQAEGALKGIPPLPVAYMARQNAPIASHVLYRGNVRDRQEMVTPGAISALRTLDPDLPSSSDQQTAEEGARRRLELANWIASSDNPLTARVFVNRLWHYHFGQGIVNTPSDFGFNGDTPTHPELLDWLANDFVDNGWQIKRMHRAIVLSATYRQGSALSEQGQAIDAGNRLLWRYLPQRLEAEAVRDNVLAVCGTLDKTLGGPSYSLFRYRDGNVPDYILLDDPGPETWRRGIYSFNIRSFSHPLMSAFDCPDPSVQTPVRQSSTTALQALSLMNNLFIFRQCEAFAARVQQVAGSSIGDQITHAYRLALSRDPEESEKAVATAFVEKHDLFSLCRVLLNTNEFLYVR